MFVIETQDAKRMRKYAILMAVILLLLGRGPAWIGVLLTMRIWTMPRFKGLGDGK